MLNGGEISVQETKGGLPESEFAIKLRRFVFLKLLDESGTLVRGVVLALRVLDEHQQQLCADAA